MFRALVRNQSSVFVQVVQGYDLMDKLKCMVEPNVLAYPTAEFYAVWRLRYDACEPRNCTVQPNPCNPLQRSAIGGGRKKCVRNPVITE